MATATLREQLLAAAKSRLAGIKIAAGYRTTPKRVSESKADLDANDLPLLILLEDFEQDATLYEEATLAGTVDERMGLEITAVVVGSDARKATAILNDLDADVARALGITLDPITGGEVIDVRRAEGAGRDGSEWSDAMQGFRAWRSLKWVVHFYHAEGAE